MSTLSLVIPPAATTRFVVATANPVDPDASRLTEDLLTGHRLTPDSALTGPALQLIKPSLVVRAETLADEIAAIANRHDEEDERERLLAAATHLVIEAETPTRYQHAIAPAVRALARVLASRTGGVLVDPCTAQVVRPVDGASRERSWFRLADQWLYTDLLVDADRARDSDVAWLRPTQCACLCLFTRGLFRFGLPELFVDEVACAYDLAATNILRGLAVQLLSRLWAGAKSPALTVEATTVVEPRHMWGYFAATPLFGQPVPIHLAESGRGELPAHRRYLEVRPQPEFPGTRAEWLGEVAYEGMGSVADWQPDDQPFLIAPPAAPSS